QRAVRALGVGGVGPLGDGEVLGDISPVEAVLGCDLGDAFLLLVTVRGKGGQVAFGGFVVLAVLRFHAEVRLGQQVHVAHSGLCQVGLVLHAVGVVVRESAVGAPVFLRDGCVFDGEVTHVQLVHGLLGHGAKVWSGQVLPALRGQFGVVGVGEVDQDTAFTIVGQADGVGVGDGVVLDLPGLGN